MKTYKEKTIKVIDQILCDICGKTCTDDFYNNHENATLEAIWGYNSRSDGQKFEIHLCESCFYDTIQWMKQKREEYLLPVCNNSIDPFNGNNYPLLG